MYTGRTFNRESVYVCGDYMDGDIYPVFQAPGKRRSRCKPTSEIQQKISPHHHLATAGYFRVVQGGLIKFVESGQLSILKKGYW